MIRKAIIDRVMQRRGRLHLYDRLDPKRTALVVIDMQNAFVAPGAPVEVPAARDIVKDINRLARELRKRGVAVIWVLHENSDGWDGFFGVFVKPEARAAAAKSLASGHEMQKPWRELDIAPGDLKTSKSRYSAFIGPSSPLAGVLKGKGIDTLLIAGTKTNVCCECTARDAMMLDYKVVMVSDANGARYPEDHLAGLTSFYQSFGDVRTTDEVLNDLLPKT